MLSLVYICIYPVNIRSLCDSLSFVFHRQPIQYPPLSCDLFSPVIPSHSFPAPIFISPAANLLVLSQYSSFLLSPSLSHRFSGLSLKTLIILKVRLKIHFLSHLLGELCYIGIHCVEHFTVNSFFIADLCCNEWKLYLLAHSLHPWTRCVSLLWPFNGF